MLPLHPLDLLLRLLLSNSPELSGRAETLLSCSCVARSASHHHVLSYWSRIGYTTAILRPTRTLEHCRQSIMMKARRIWYPHETTTWAHFLHGVKRSRSASGNDRETSALLHPWTLW